MCIRDSYYPASEVLQTALAEYYGKPDISYVTQNSKGYEPHRRNSSADYSRSFIGQKNLKITKRVKEGGS